MIIEYKEQYLDYTKKLANCNTKNGPELKELETTYLQSYNKEKFEESRTKTDPCYIPRNFRDNRTDGKIRAILESCGIHGYGYRRYQTLKKKMVSKETFVKWKLNRKNLGVFAYPNCNRDKTRVSQQISPLYKTCQQKACETDTKNDGTLYSKNLTSCMNSYKSSLIKSTSKQCNNECGKDSFRGCKKACNSCNKNYINKTFASLDTKWFLSSTCPSVYNMCKSDRELIQTDYSKAYENCRTTSCGTGHKTNEEGYMTNFKNCGLKFKNTEDKLLIDRCNSKCKSEKCKYVCNDCNSRYNNEFLTSYKAKLHNLKYDSNTCPKVIYYTGCVQDNNSLNKMPSKEFEKCKTQNCDAGVSSDKFDTNVGLCITN